MVTNSGYEKINIFTWYCVHVFGTRWLHCPILSFRQEGYFHFFCIFDWYYFTYVAWCNYVKVSGIMESTLPFQWMMICTLQRVLLRMKLFSPDYEHLNHMEYFYRKEVPELQSVVRVFLREREKVRVVQYSQIDSIGVSGDKKGLHWYQWKSTLFQWFYWWICISLRRLRLFAHVV